MKSFIRNIPTTMRGQCHWVITKAQERLGKAAVCTDCLQNALPVDTIEELYELVSEVCWDTEYWEN